MVDSSIAALQKEINGLRPAFTEERKLVSILFCDIVGSSSMAAERTACSETSSMVENLVLTDLLAWRDAILAHRPGLFYWRAVTGEEVDFVVEWKGRLIAIEIKATTSPRLSDAKHLGTFRAEYGDSVHGCLLLHGGSRFEVLASGILAVPWWAVT